VTATYNMAEWPIAERKALNADLIACRIRQECKGMAQADRQKRAREVLEKLAPDMRELVVEAMRRRAQ